MEDERISEEAEGWWNAADWSQTMRLLAPIFTGRPTRTVFCQHANERAEKISARRCMKDESEGQERSCQARQQWRPTLTQAVGDVMTRQPPRRPKSVFLIKRMNVRTVICRAEKRFLEVIQATGAARADKRPKQNESNDDRSRRCPMSLSALSAGEGT